MLAQKEKKAANIFAGNISLILFFITFIIVVLAEIFMPNVISILAPGYIENSIKFDQLIISSRITFPFLALITMCSIYSSVLNAHEKFAISAALPIILNIILILAALAAYYLDGNILIFLSCSVILAGMLQFLLLIFSIKKK